MPKTTKKKTCGKNTKVTGFAITWAGVVAAFSVIGNTIQVIYTYCQKMFEPLKEAGKLAMAAAAAVLGFASVVIWKAAAFLSVTGFNALRELLIDLWQNAHKKTIQTKNIRTLLRDIKRKLLLKNPKYKQHNIMIQIKQLNELCFMIDSMNEHGMTKIVYEGMKIKVSNEIKSLLIEFGKLMSTT